MATTPKSCKAKGRRFQKDVATAIQKALKLNSRDVVSTPASCTGEDILFSEKASQLFPYSVEAKCRERLDVWSAIKQAESNAPPGRTPMVVFKRNRSDTYCIINFNHFLDTFRCATASTFPPITEEA